MYSAHVNARGVIRARAMVSFIWRCLHLEVSFDRGLAVLYVVCTKR